MEEYEKAQIEPETIGYIECHGTGTSLGDPVEIQALNKAFSEIHKSHNKTPAKTAYCGLSSLKSNIGHLETAAGVASLLKVVLAIKHKQIPASIHFEEINPFIDLKGTPFYVVNKLTPWEAATDEHGLPLPRRAGVSCFGFGGANAHIVLEEYIPPARQSLPQAKDPQLIVLSAKNEKRLNAYVQLMRTYLEKEEIELIDFAYTLQVGRDEMPERLAWVVSSKEELKQKIDNILRGGDAPKDNYRNNTNKDSKSRVVDGGEGETLVRDLIKQKELSKLAELWVSGVKIAWRSLYDSDVPNRISIPTYPFARERYWFPSAERNAVEKQSHHGRMAAESLPAKNAAKDAAPQPSTEQPSVVTTRQAAPMTAEAKMELLLKQEVALQLPGPVDAISISLTYFDLGLGSLGIMNLVHKINELLQESLPISVVFEYRNIESLAAYLAATYPAKVAGLAVNIEEEVTQYSEDSAKATRLPEENYFLARPAPSLHEQTDATTARYEIADKQVLERLWWHEKSLDESYEKVTF
jgi:acyl transferase domain-containing protein